MSKFFDESSSSSSESESDNEVIEVKPTRKPQMTTMYDSDEEEKKTRIVLPEKAKRYKYIALSYYFNKYNNLTLLF